MSAAPISQHSSPSSSLSRPPYWVDFPHLPSASSRLLLIGDVHGCLDEAKELVDCALPDRNSSDGIIFVGDLLAKGPESSKVLELVRSLGAWAILGNHEQRILKAAHQIGRMQKIQESLGGTTDFSYYATLPMGGATVHEKSQHFRLAEELSDSDLAYLASLPLMLRIPQFNAVALHAGVEPAFPLDAQKSPEVLTIRNVDSEGKSWKAGESEKFPWASKWSGPEFLIFGHDAARKLQQYPNAIGLDTGCVYGFKLTGLLLPSKQLVQVQAKKIYEIPKGND